jgi:hypothetical protein
MNKYESTYAGEDQSAAQEFSNLSQVLTGEIVVPNVNVEPERPRYGRVVVADGTDWDPLTAGVPRLVWFNGTSWVALDA